MLKGNQSEFAQFVLMNKNTPILEFCYDLETHVVASVDNIINAQFAPPGVFDRQGEITRKALTNWWRGRAIPASRDQLQVILDNLNLDSSLALAEQSFGLSLSDRYWLNDVSNPQCWDDINFFTNAFTEDLGLLTLGQSSFSAGSLVSPNSSLGGDLRKKWTIVDGRRILVKAGSGFSNQEPYNEVIATKLFEALGFSQDEYVSYWLVEDRGNIYCACNNMLREDEELVAAYDLLWNQKKSNNFSDYQFAVNRFEELGVKNAEEHLTKMFVSDFILANSDRHYRNFGVIRNVETLQYVRMAPIFDTGACLWSWAQTLDTPRDFEYCAKPFKREGMRPLDQLKLFTEWDWFDERLLADFPEIAYEVLCSNPALSKERAEAVVRALRKNIEQVTRVARS